MITTTSKSTGKEESNECFFCERMMNSSSYSALKERTIYEDELFHVSHQFDEAPTYLGLVLIQTKRHVNDLSELSEPESQELGSLIARISKALKATTGAAWTYCYSFLEGYRHVHLLVTSRYPSVPKEYVRLAIGDWPEAPVGGKKEVEELSNKLRLIIVPH